MKKLLFAGVMALGLFTATAQTKIGYINTDELIASMPEAAKAQAELQEYQTGLGQQYQDLQNELNTKDSIFVKDSTTYSPSKKEIKRKELIELYQKVQNYQQDSQEQYQAKANALITPIREKALNAIKTVAKEAGYSYIFNEDNLLVMPPSDNIIGLVKAKLGIKDAPKTAPAPVKKP
ncbi:OmpH family outer membrane protein [Ferruginibacter yonginensis]|uniref:OmpH family outer membrane protein n=1 Tax=Ferruginibacter yonginensis TaxID=1310416 RepID=A0ABV8QSW8_9BACT